VRLRVARRRGSAFLWVFVVLILGALVVTASLAISRQNTRDRVVTLERADGLAYAGLAAEVAIALVREHTNFVGAYSGPAEVRGSLNPYGSRMDYVVDLSSFDAADPARRSLRVVVTPDVERGAVRPFVAVARLRPNLSVGDWVVVDYDAPVVAVNAPGLPSFASCTAQTLRVVGAGASPAAQYDNVISWVYENAVVPDRVVVSWLDFRSGDPVVVTVNTLLDESVVSVGVLTPFPAVDARGFFAPRSVPYLLSMFFEGKLVDSCVVDVTSGRFEVVLVHPPVGVPLCFEGDTVTVRWRFNVDSGVLAGFSRGGSLSYSIPVGEFGSREFVLPGGAGSEFRVGFRHVAFGAPTVVVVEVQTGFGLPPCYLSPPAA
jgi:hypothetical protein